MSAETLEYIRDMASELAKLSKAGHLDVLAYLFRMAEAEAEQLGPVRSRTLARTSDRLSPAQAQASDPSPL